MRNDQHFIEFYLKTPSLVNHYPVCRRFTAAAETLTANGYGHARLWHLWHTGSLDISFITNHSDNVCAFPLNTSSENAPMHKTKPK